MITEILTKLNIEPINKEAFQILAASIRTVLEYSDNINSLVKWDAPVLPDLNKLEPGEIKFLESEAQKTIITIEECQLRVQKLIPQDKRKRFAAYYTTKDGAKIMALITRNYINTRKEKVVLADPFLGSGITLTTAIEETGITKIKRVWGIEPLALPALVAYASLLHKMKGRRDAISIIVGDAFSIASETSSLFTNSQLLKADIILTNPPFTRWEYLESEYRKFLLPIIKKLGYEKYTVKEGTGLHVLSVFLCDYILNENGLLISVLPASTFYTIYGRGCKSLLKDKYEILAVIENKLKTSFSEGSGFKEIITVAVKKPGRGLTTFVEVDNNNIEEVVRIITSKEPVSFTRIDLKNLPEFLDINWLAFFGNSELRNILVDVFNQGLRNGTLGYWNKILGRKSIVRGIEMYGPEFFFIPNKYWEVVKMDENFLTVQNKHKKLNIDRKFLVKTLRKPSLYSHRILANVDTFMLSIPPVETRELPEDLQKYIKWGIDSGTAKPAVSFYGKYWYSHVYKQITTKQPFGQLFVPDKVDLLFKNRSVFVNYTDEEVAASKNFYVVRGKNEILTKLLLGWFNSTIFISILVLLGRKISETWTRFLESDYLELPVINPAGDNNKMLLEVIESIDQILNKPLPSLWDQLNKEYRYRLDLAIARLVKVKDPEGVIKKLYQSLNNLLHKIQ